MGKVSPISAKYIIHASINTEGVVDRPDVIGAIFGQTEGLLGADLEYRELQRSGRIGRIEVNVDTISGKTSGTIIIPSSLDKAETAIIAAALEIIQRIGPCNARIKVHNIEDIRVSKRQFVVERAKELLKNLMDTAMPDSQELADEVTHSVRVMEIQEYGKDRLPCGPLIDESDDIIVVEGRADVLNLLKHGIKNSIALNGTSVPATLIELSKQKIATAFVDGDRGGDLIIKELLAVANIDFVTKAPDGKEVEELTKKEIHIALRARVAPEQVKPEAEGEHRDSRIRPEQRMPQRPQMQREQPRARPSSMPLEKLGMNEKRMFKQMAEDLIGTRGAFILNEKLDILGKVPGSELAPTIRNLSSVYAVVFDGIIDKELVRITEGSNLHYLVGMESHVKPQETPVKIITLAEL